MVRCRLSEGFCHSTEAFRHRLEAFRHRPEAFRHPSKNPEIILKNNWKNMKTRLTRKTDVV